jgi:hypothetical protein
MVAMKLIILHPRQRAFHSSPTRSTHVLLTLSSCSDLKVLVITLMRERDFTLRKCFVSRCLLATNTNTNDVSCRLILGLQKFRSGTDANEDTRRIRSARLFRAGAAVNNKTFQASLKIPLSLIENARQLGRRLPVRVTIT